MNKHLRAIILSFLCLQAIAQSNVKDSLLASLKRSEIEQRSFILMELAELYQTSDPDSSIVLAREGLALARHMKNADNIALGLYRIGVAHRMKGEYKKSEEYFLKSLEICKTINNEKLIAANLNSIGITYVGLGIYSKALEFYLQALKKREEVHDWKGVAATLSNIGIVHTQQNNFSKAYNCHAQALKILHSIPDSRQDAAVVLDNFAYLYKKQGNYVKALETYNAIYNTFMLVGDKVGVHSCLLNMGDIYLEQGNSIKAYEYYTQGLHLAQEINAKDAIAQDLIGLSRVYSVTDKLIDGLSAADKALELAKESGAKQIVKQASLMLYKKHKELKNYNKALYYFEVAHAVDDSILVTENAKVGFALQANYDLEKKHTQMASVHQIAQKALTKYAQQHYLFLGVLLGIGIIVYLLIRNLLQERKIDQLLVKQKMSELAYLNAHKIRGPVASILGLVTLYNRTNLADDFNQVVISHIDTSAKELDRMIHEVANKTQLVYQMHEQSGEKIEL
ncbi:tetratricopeptide repeat protein [Cytophagaceae bacterium YF14B1]|uniref:Tetratricopeptide repeat protein n=1 Tax=Xanthocytophaga flava TaxID=3048013 RepID=A0AAE3QT73_9BACT|nr:tetratricopeptide repeat protein [Xanthocytophaga flavus]MDJ1484491.1 tetratricopeptide repeat protein [Xanthocytophaga flavus]